MNIDTNNDIKKESSVLKTANLKWIRDKEIVDNYSFGKVSYSHTIKISGTNHIRGIRDGLYDPVIFGNFSSYECACGIKDVVNKGRKCPDCLVSYEDNVVNRIRGGHIDLSTEVVNMVKFKNLPFPEILSISSNDLKSVVYYDSYVVINPGKSKILSFRQILKKIDPSLFLKILEDILKTFNDNGINPSKNFFEKKAILESMVYPEKFDLINKDEENTLPSMFFIEEFLFIFENEAGIKILTGANAIKELISLFDVEKELKKLEDNKKKISLNNNPKDIARCSRLNDKIRILRPIIENGIDLAGVVTSIIYVIPSGIRPAIEADGSIITVQINYLYQSILDANNDLIKFQDPEFIFTLNSKDSVEYNAKNNIFGNKRRFKNIPNFSLVPIEVINETKRRIQILYDKLLFGGDDKAAPNVISILGGKEGLIRKGSLAKRVNNCARLVLSPDPNLKLHQATIPLGIFLTIFEDLIVSKIIKRGITSYKKEAENMVRSSNPVIFSIVNKLLEEKMYIAINRAPTLHSLSIQVFEVGINFDRTVKMPSIKFSAFNADCDGDCMTILTAVTPKALKEFKENMLSSLNIIDPKNGELIDLASQDMILGIYYLSSEKKPTKGLKYFSSINNLELAYEFSKIDLNDIICLPAEELKKIGKKITNKKGFIFTTLGKIIFNKNCPYPFYISSLDSFNSVEINELMSCTKDFSEIINPDRVLETFEKMKKFSSFEELKKFSGWSKKTLNSFLGKMLHIVGKEKIVDLLDKISELGFKYATVSGMTMSVFGTMKISNDKEIEIHNRRIKEIEESFSDGFISKREKDNLVTLCLMDTKQNIDKKFLNYIHDNYEEYISSPIGKIHESGSRITDSTLTNIMSSVGLVSNGEGGVYQYFIRNSYRDGLDPYDFKFLRHSTTDGMIALHLNTFLPGEMSRSLAESSHYVITSGQDCGTDGYMTFSDIFEEDDNESVLIPFEKLIYGKYLFNDLINNDNQTVISKNSLILNKELKIIKNMNIKSLAVRHYTKCWNFPKICVKCYGLDYRELNKPVKERVAVGMIATQSNGEPLTQLNMDKFHQSSYTSSFDDISRRGLPEIKRIYDCTSDKLTKSFISEANGIITSIKENEKSFVVEQNDELNNKHVYYIPKNNFRKMIVREGDFINKGKRLTNGQINLQEELDIIGKDESYKINIGRLYNIHSNQSGISISEVNLGMFIHLILSRVKIIEEDTEDSKFSNYLRGDIIDYAEYERINRLNPKIKAKNIILSMRKIRSKSWLSAISFQNFPKALVDYSIESPIDDLTSGIKNSLLMGQKMPVGDLD